MRQSRNRANAGRQVSRSAKWSSCPKSQSQRSFHRLFLVHWRGTPENTPFYKAAGAQVNVIDHTPIKGSVKQRTSAPPAAKQSGERAFESETAKNRLMRHQFARQFDGCWTLWKCDCSKWGAKADADFAIS